jgi:hypothetical protein
MYGGDVSQMVHPITVTYLKDKYESMEV